MTGTRSLKLYISELTLGIHEKNPSNIPNKGLNDFTLFKMIVTRFVSTVNYYYYYKSNEMH